MGALGGYFRVPGVVTELVLSFIFLTGTWDRRRTRCLVSIVKVIISCPSRCLEIINYYNLCVGFEHGPQRARVFGQIVISNIENAEKHVDELERDLLQTLTYAHTCCTPDLGLANKRLIDGHRHVVYLEPMQKDKNPTSADVKQDLNLHDSLIQSLC